MKKDKNLPPPKNDTIMHPQTNQATSLSHTIYHTQLCHTPSFTRILSHTIFHTQLCHPPSFTRNFVTHHLSHTTLSPTMFHTPLSHTTFTHHLSPTSLSHTIFHTHLCHTPSFTHNFVTQHLSHTTLSHTIFHTQLCHTPFFTHNVTHHLLNFTWQAWHLVTSTCVLRGRCGTWRHLPAFGVAGVALVAFGGTLGRRCSLLAGVALGGIHLRFAWQAWHLESSTCVCRGRRGTW